MNPLACTCAREASSCPQHGYGADARGERDKVLTRQVVVRLEPLMLAALERHAAANDRTVSQTVRFLLKQALGSES